MLRTTLCALLGTLAGAALTPGLLALTQVVRNWQTSPAVFAAENSVVYLAPVLGAGFGAVTGALIGLAGVLLTAKRTAEKT